LYNTPLDRRPFVKYLRVLLCPVLAIAVAAAVACGDDEADQPEATSPAATQEEEDTPRATATSGDTGGATSPDTSPLDDEVQVQAADFSFTPESFALPAGAEAKIEVRNAGAFPHTLTVYSDEVYTSAVAGADTGSIEAGEDASIETTFERGEYFFRCEIHPTQMEGEFTAE
jgi:plastocyanin